MDYEVYNNFCRINILVKSKPTGTERCLSPCAVITCKAAQTRQHRLDHLQNINLFLVLLQFDIQFMLTIDIFYDLMKGSEEPTCCLETVVYQVSLHCFRISTRYPKMNYESNIAITHQDKVSNLITTLRKEAISIHLRDY